MKPLQVLLTLFAFALLPLYAASLDDLTYTTNNGEVTITDCNEDATGELVIPDTIGGNPVTSIGEEAFFNCSVLTTINIPDSVTSIAGRAFDSCTNLTSITIPDGVTSIGSGAFWGCSSLPSITIPDSVTSIGNNAFDSCTSLTSITIPDSITHIGAEAFAGTPTVFTEVENINFLLGREGKRAYLIDGSQASGAIDLPTMVGGAEVLLISDSAFFNCTVLTSITIPVGVTSIGDGVFSACTNLTSITIPDGVTSIGGGAFDGCTSLPSITIGNDVTSIGEDAFRNCSSLPSIMIPDSVTSIGDGAFRYCINLTSITIPDRFSAHYSRIGLSADQSQPLFNKAVAANDIVSSNTTRIEAIEAQLALLADALAAKDAEIATKNERIAALELRPTQAAYDTVVTERDARPTLEEIQDARTGSVILTPSEDGTVQLKIEIEESSDLEVWENNGESVDVELPLAEGKKFLRFALK